MDIKLPGQGPGNTKTEEVIDQEQPSQEQQAAPDMEVPDMPEPSTEEIAAPEGNQPQQAGPSYETNTTPPGVNQMPASEGTAPMPGGGLTQEQPIAAPEGPAPIPEGNQPLGTQPTETTVETPQPQAPEIGPDTATINLADHPTAESLENAVGGSPVEPSPEPAMDMTPEQHQALKPEAPRSREDEVIDQISQLHQERTKLVERLNEIDDKLEALLDQFREVRDQNPEAKTGESV